MLERLAHMYELAVKLALDLCRLPEDLPRFRELPSQRPLFPLEISPSIYQRQAARHAFSGPLRIVRS